MSTTPIPACPSCGHPLPSDAELSRLLAEVAAGLAEADTGTARVRWVSANRQGRCLRCANRAYDAYLLEEKMPTTKKILSRSEVQAARAAAAPPPAEPPPQHWAPRLPKVPAELHHPEPPELRCLARLQELGLFRAPTIPDHARPPRRKWGRSKTAALLFAGAALGAAARGDALGATRMIDLADGAQAGGAL